MKYSFGECQKHELRDTVLLTYLKQNTAQVVEYLGVETLSKSCRAECDQVRGSILGIILIQCQLEGQISTFCLVKS